MRTRLFSLLLVTGLLAGCHEKTDNTEAVQPVKVRTVTVNAERRTPTNSYSGTVEEENGTPLSFSTSGTVQRLYIRLGQRVAAGQLVATLDSTSLQSSYQATRATLLQAEDAYRRMKELHDKGSLPDIKWVEVQSQVEQARSMEQIARKALNDCRLYAPYAGVIAEKSVEVGQNVMPGTPVARLVTASHLQVKIAVPEAEIGHLSLGQTGMLTVPALNGRTFRCSLTEKGIVARPLSRSYDVRLRVEDAGNDLLPGMVADVSLAMPDDSTVCIVPEHIVQIDEKNREFVWVDRDGKAEKRYIVCGDFVTGGVAVTQGLEADERILVEGQHKVCNDTPIEVIENQ